MMKISLISGLTNEEVSGYVTAALAIAGIILSYAMFRTKWAKTVKWLAAISILLAVAAWKSAAIKAKEDQDQATELKHQLDSSKLALRQVKDDLKKSEQKVQEYHERMQQIMADAVFFMGVKDYTLREVSYNFYTENNRNFKSIESKFVGSLLSKYPKAEVVFTIGTVVRPTVFHFRRTNNSLTCLEMEKGNYDRDTIADILVFKNDIFLSDSSVANFKYGLKNRFDSSDSYFTVGDLYETLKGLPDEEAPIIFSIEIINIDGTEEELDAWQEVVLEKFENLHMSFDLNRAIGLSMYAYFTPSEMYTDVDAKRIFIGWSLDGPPTKFRKFYPVVEDMCMITK